MINKHRTRKTWKRVHRAHGEFFFKKEQIGKRVLSPSSAKEKEIESQNHRIV